ncbi:hypothetical protein [Paenisporosarcina indica]|uniref:hypothetical protein n=1 Tax=Paenisporosarcina indica TaxID=650093 RepID=UPI000AFD7179|nr:hypothetical protein [Paenisporosarcina indica]
MKTFSVLVLLLLLSACSESDVSAPPVTSSDQPIHTNEHPSKIVAEPDKSGHETLELSSYFMRDGVVANYLGEGNEYASYQARTQWHNENTVSIYEDNGGTTVLRTYRITEDSIDLIQEQGEFYDTFTPSSAELEKLPVISTFLQIPLEKGSTFGKWIIMDVKQTVQTPFRTFDNVIILEMKDESGVTNRKYIAKDFGEVKREFILNEAENDFIVTSTLESMK